MNYHTILFFFINAIFIFVSSFVSYKYAAENQLLITTIWIFLALILLTQLLFYIKKFNNSSIPDSLREIYSKTKTISTNTAEYKYIIQKLNNNIDKLGIEQRILDTQNVNTIEFISDMLEEYNDKLSGYSIFVHFDKNLKADITIDRPIFKKIIIEIIEEIINKYDKQVVDLIFTSSEKQENSILCIIRGLSYSDSEIMIINDIFENKKEVIITDDNIIYFTIKNLSMKHQFSIDFTKNNDSSYTISFYFNQQ